MESMWSVAFAAVMVIGVGAATPGGIVLEHLLPTYFGKRADGKLEVHIGRVQERVDFLERLLRGEPEREIGNP